MALSSRRAVAALRRTTNRQCGLLIPSANLPPRPIYYADKLVRFQQCRHESTGDRGDDFRYFDSEGVFNSKKVGKQLEEMDIAQKKLEAKADGAPTAGELFGWPEAQEEDKDYEMPKDLNNLPQKLRKALKLKQLPRQPITAENLFSKLQITDTELDQLAKTGRFRDDPKYKAHGLVPFKPEDIAEEDLEGMADLSEVNSLIGNVGFSESEIMSIMRDQDEPQNEMDFMKRIIEETEKDMKEDLIRLQKHEEAMLQEEIKMRVAEGMSAEQAEHDARAIMRLPQQRTETRRELSRDLSDDAIIATETLWNTELEEMGEKGLRTMMKKMDHAEEYASRPLRPDQQTVRDMYFLPPSKREDDDDMDPMMWSWNATDMSSMAHDDLEEHREARKYARLAVYDMPRLSKFVKPFKVPTAAEVLRFRYTTHMGVSHPTNNKVVMECCPEDLGLTRVQTDKLIKLCGARYNPTTKLLKFSCEMFEHQHQNKRWLSELVDKLIIEAKDDTDTFEDVPFDFRHHKFKPQPSFPKEWRMTKEKLELKRLKDWQKHATPGQWEQLKTYIHYQTQEQKRLALEAGKKESGVDVASLERTAEEVPVLVA
ncbi:37S ribosomal protein S24, mitochondrial [Orbilia oligospora]|uniref:37S ribosomal protein S24, mitochondrial n=1 Tax=Orbilia oligospora TaxID=2813651 RepID=A0A7C8K5M1_ORBOL|nr:37S ribosomal protein S24, mitochondrial [Orbilia oligospora]KAF3104473.1 37S ribosomal protein S24, mitochondrial [Orbilia oligospora]KAF3128302.1 37S ribosomal protein S24, mitochondrial [Orbilia oligospora]KAF3147347.1 37S ribosomal protein S24, mitochondrial [Orbilia oligospora]KAF3157516.1 37S ribosomal protein S24, mitochondrial [Orbilia oligospora]